MYCDTHGEHGYRLRGRIPIRTHDDATWLPVEGSSGQHSWERFIPHAEMPSCRNPVEGFCVTANQKVTTDEYPYVISQHYGSDHRALRIVARIEEVLKPDRSVSAWWPRCALLQL